MTDKKMKLDSRVEKSADADVPREMIGFAAESEIKNPARWPGS